jgi:predicted N-acetyltransferase YhbS
MTDSLIIRPAQRGDPATLHPVIERAYRGETARAGWTHEADLIQGPRTNLNTLSAILESRAERLLVAEQDGAIVGCVQVSDRGSGLAYLGLLCIEPGLQAAGLGRQLIGGAEATARTAFGATRMEMTVIDVRHGLIAYYERRGYEQTGERRDFVLKMDPPLFMTVLAKSLV